MTAKAQMIGVDWGTTHARAWLLDAGGEILARNKSDAGVSMVEPGGFPGAFEVLCGRWPRVPAVMAGMIGSRNGWVEAPYVSAPCGAGDVAGAFAALENDRIHIAPGVDFHAEDATYDVMRGEETKCFGAGVSDGILCLPGTHCKWVEMRAGRIIRFATFATGEVYGAMANSFLGRLAEDPGDDTGAPRGLAAAALEGGVLRALFQARAQVLSGAMRGGQVRPFISGLLVGAEISGALAMFGAPARVHLIAGPPQSGLYPKALGARGAAAALIDPEAAFLSGLRALAQAACLIRD